jgi:antitoxin component of MazEF toxin-antitoxin module
LPPIPLVDRILSAVVGHRVIPRTQGENAYSVLTWAGGCAGAIGPPACMATLTRRVDAKSRVVLPEQFAGKVVKIESVGENELKIKLARAPRRRPSLRSLVEGITETNVHEAVEFGRPSGEEQL